MRSTPGKAAEACQQQAQHPRRAVWLLPPTVAMLQNHGRVKVITAFSHVMSLVQMVGLAALPKDLVCFAGTACTQVMPLVLHHNHQTQDFMPTVKGRMHGTAEYHTILHQGITLHGHLCKQHMQADLSWSAGAQVCSPVLSASAIPSLCPLKNRGGQDRFSAS